MVQKHFGPTKDKHIYLSTSNQASPDDVRIVRTYLKKKGWTIIEHEGGIYNNQLLFETSMMIMVGYNTGYQINRKVGRGQYKQLYDRESYAYDSNWMFTGCTIEGQPEFYPVITNGIIDDAAYKRDYGVLQVDLVPARAIHLQDYNKVGVKTTKVEWKESKRYDNRSSWLDTENSYGEDSKYKVVAHKRKLRLIRGLNL